MQLVLFEAEAVLNFKKGMFFKKIYQFGLLSIYFFLKNIRNLSLIDLIYIFFSIQCEDMIFSALLSYLNNTNFCLIKLILSRNNACRPQKIATLLLFTRQTECLIELPVRSHF